VILEVVPIISDDGQIVMAVSPEVSTARINPTSKVPDSEATKVTTTVMLTDGQAIVIGGLIKETVNDSQNKVPFLGDLWVVGRLFQSRDRLVERSEIIITLLPRITGPGDCGTFVASDDLAQASAPLMDQNLNLYDRSAWEGSLPDASKKSRFWNIFRKQKQEKAAPAPMMEMPVTVETQPVSSAEIGFSEIKGVRPL
jgi:Flp pilus assembly secretin CpaC